MSVDVDPQQKIILCYVYSIFNNYPVFNRVVGNSEVLFLLKKFSSNIYVFGSFTSWSKFMTGFLTIPLIVSIFLSNALVARQIIWFIVFFLIVVQFIEKNMMKFVYENSKIILCRCTSIACAKFNIIYSMEFFSFNFIFIAFIAVTSKLNILRGSEPTSG